MVFLEEAGRKKVLFEAKTQVAVRVPYDMRPRLSTGLSGMKLIINSGTMIYHVIRFRCNIFSLT